MIRKAVIFLLLVLCMLVFLNLKVIPHAGVRVRDGERIVGELHKGVEVKQVFTCQEAVRGIWIRVYPCSPYSGIGTGDLILNLSSINVSDIRKDPSKWSEEKLVSKKIDVSQIKEPSTQVFWFGPQKVSNNKAYCITLTSTSHHGKAAAVYMTSIDLYKKGSCYINGALFTGNLAFQAIMDRQSIIQVFTRISHKRTLFYTLLNPYTTLLFLILFLFVLSCVVDQINKMDFIENSSSCRNKDIA